MYHIAVIFCVVCVLRLSGRLRTSFHCWFQLGCHLFVVRVRKSGVRMKDKSAHHNAQSCNTCNGIIRQHFNPFMPSILVYLYSLDQPISKRRGIWILLLLLLLLYFKGISVFNDYSVYPVQTPRSAASYLVLYCSPMFRFWTPGTTRFSIFENGGPSQLIHIFFRWKLEGKGSSVAVLLCLCVCSFSVAFILSLFVLRLSFSSRKHTYMDMMLTPLNPTFI